MPQRSTRVLYDDEAFIRHRRSGITRYFAEIISEFRADASLGVVPVTPYRWVANAHLVHRDSRRYTHVPLPPEQRVRFLERVNRRRVRTVGPVDVVHFSLYETTALSRWSAPTRVSTIYDFTFERLPDVFPDLGSQVADKNTFIESCDALFCISETTLSDLRLFHPHLDKFVAVTPLGVADEFFEPSPVPIRGLPERYVLHVGNRHSHKNVDLLFRAFAELAGCDPTLRLVLCGAARPDETDRLQRLGILDRTVRLRVGEAALPWLYHRAAAFVFPSRHEGFGLPVVEALASGCPTIAADIPVLREVGGEAVTYVNPEDCDGLVDALARVLRSPQEAGRLRTAGRVRARDFTWRRTAEATSRAYLGARQA